MLTKTQIEAVYQAALKAIQEMGRDEFLKATWFPWKRAKKA